MSIHRPGLPEDLPAPELLWARWAAIAVVTATAERDSDRDPVGYWLDEEGLHLNDPDTGWWTLIKADDGRALLYGEDQSSTVGWHEPPVDLLAGAPDWLPYETLTYLPDGYELGCVYWCEDDVWSRAPYPDGLRDDGLAGGMERFRTPAAAATELAGYLDEDIPLERITELLEHAERETLSQGVLETFGSEFAWDDSDPHAMTEALGRSGLDGRMG